MKKIKYYIAMALTFLQAPLIFIGIMLVFFSKTIWTYLYTKNKLNTSIGDAELSKIILISIVIGVVILAINLILIKPITTFRQNTREEMKYDSYGRLKDENEYKKLSVKEQKELDAERIRELNKILPGPVVKQMTKEGSSNPDVDLGLLIGLESAKESVMELMARMNLEKETERNKMDTAQHMVFYGPPGTGKTTVARIMTGVLYNYHYIQRNELIETSGAFFLDPNAGKKMQAICQRAYGGVLFIDEAYAMTYSQEGLEAIAELIKNMEDAKDKFVLILAGYRNEMQELLESNPGFYSRIKTFIKFDNYSNEELLEILRFMASKQGVVKITRGGEEKFLHLIEDIRYDDDFGNARTVRNLLDQSISREALLRFKGISKSKGKDPIILNEDNIVYKKNELAAM